MPRPSYWPGGCFGRMLDPPLVDGSFEMPSGSVKAIEMELIIYQVPKADGVATLEGGVRSRLLHLLA